MIRAHVPVSFRISYNQGFKYQPKTNIPHIQCLGFEVSDIQYTIISVRYCRNLQYHQYDTPNIVDFDTIDNQQLLISIPIF